MGTAEAWAAEEFGDAEFGDRRLTRRCVSLAAEVLRRPAGTVTRACHSSASREGAFRFLENSTVRSAKVLECVERAAARRCAGFAKVIVPVDGTSLRVTDVKQSKGIGWVGSLSHGARGVHVMSAFAVTMQGAPLGIVAQEMWVREGRSPRTARTHSGGRRPTYGGEIVHWPNVLERARESLLEYAPRTVPWFQLDRGADCWQVLLYAQKAGALCTIRATHDRRVDDELGSLLWATIERERPLCTRRIQVAKKAAFQKRVWKKTKHVKVRILPQAQRVAKVTIRARAVTLRVPSPEGVKDVSVNAVLVSEKDTSAVHRVEWLLLTAHPIGRLDEVLEVVRAYALRWRVEDFHRAWKRGVCRVEDTQLRSREAIYKWATLLAAVATRAMKLAERARVSPDAPASVEFSKVELEAILALRRPRDTAEKDLTLARAVRWVAEIGGHTGPWNGPPGATTIARGLHDVLVTARAFEYRDAKR
jgi:Transposase DNA-binding/Transposase DDE domain